MVARSLDMAFFSLLGGACLYVLIRNLVYSTLLSAGLLLFYILWDRRRWHRYRQCIWQEGPEPRRERVVERLRRNAPKRDGALWKRLLDLPGNRYLLTGVLLLLLSIILRRALYWRILGSLCLLIGAIRRSVTLYRET